MISSLYLYMTYQNTTHKIPPPPITERESAFVALTMAKLTKDILHHYSADWIRARAPQTKISYSPGAGDATHLKYDIKLTNLEITYGRLCARDHFRYHSIGGWTHFHELIKFNIKNDTLGVTTLLTATCIHEFSHLISALHRDADEYSGSHHKLFYSVLKKIHKNPISVEFNKELDSALLSKGIPLTFSCGKSVISQEQIEFWDTLKAGDQGVFIRRSNRRPPSVTMCTVSKVNQKSIDVLIEDKEVRLSKYRLFHPEHF